MKKRNKEILHYVILALVLTGAVFLAYFSSQAVGLVDFLTSSSGFLKIVSWMALFGFYLVFIGAFLVITDLILHKSLKI